MNLTPKSKLLYAGLFKRGVDWLRDPEEARRTAGRQVNDRNQWARPEQVVDPRYVWQNNPGSILLGHFNNHLIGTAGGDDRHLLTVAGTRGGKTSRVILPNLYTYPGSIIALDPKGELATKSAKHRHDVLGHRVFVLDPYGEASECGLSAASWDPLGEIDPASPEAIDDARKIADAIVVTTGKESEKHWTESAKSILSAVILYVINMPDAMDAPPRSLVTVRDMIMLATPEIINLAKREPIEEAAAGASKQASARMRAFFSLLEDCTEIHHGFVANQGAAIASMADRERESVFSTLRTQTKFLDSVPMRAALNGRPFRLADLKHEPVTLYLCLPQRYLAEQMRWMRLVVALALAAFERDKTKPAHPVLFLLEEFPVLGRFHEIENAAGLVAGYGIKLWFIIQDISQLETLYDKAWHTFAANSGIVQAFAVSEPTTLDYLSNRLGRTTFWQEAQSDRTLQQQQTGASGESRSQVTAELASSSELAALLVREDPGQTEAQRLRAGHQLILPAGEAPRVIHLLHHDTVPKIAAGELPEVARLRTLATGRGQA